MKTQIMNGEGGIIDKGDIPINTEPNRNILIIGSSGTGKTYLGDIIKELYKPKINIIFKEEKGKEYFKVKNYRPEISDKVNFLNSFKDTLEISEMGIMGSEIIPTLKTILENTGSINELKERMKEEKNIKKGMLEKEIINYIKEKINSLYPNIEQKNEYKIIKYNKTNNENSIISLDNMTEYEQIFFSDYLLRLNYSIIKDEPIMIDEMHRIKILSNGIISQIIREIRHKGQFIAISQSLTDLPDHLLNNFGTIIQFRSLNFSDLEKYRIINKDLPNEIMNLENHEFIEIYDYIHNIKHGRMRKYKIISD